MLYASVAFMQGDDATEVLDLLCNKYPDSDICYYGADNASVRRAVSTLIDLETHDPPPETSQEMHAGDGDEIALVRPAGRGLRCLGAPHAGLRPRTGDYLLSWHLGRGTIGLERVAAPQP
jgi:hypothetical protein